MRDDIDVRLHDYHNHSREYAHVDRVKESWEGKSLRKVTVGSRTITVPESEAEFLGEGLKDQPFPIRDEV